MENLTNIASLISQSRAIDSIENLIIDCSLHDDQHSRINANIYKEISFQICH